MQLKRKLHLIKHRIQILMHNLTVGLFKFLAKCHLVLEHKKNCTNIRDLSSPQPMPDIQGDRFVFEATYLHREVEFIAEHWFTNRKGKKLFVVYDDSHKSGRICYRAELKSFFAHFSPRQRMWVHRHSPVLQKYVPADLVYPDAPYIKMVNLLTHRCDFSQCRYAFEFSYELDPKTNGMPSEVISESYRVLKNGLTSKVTEINKILTGANCDGEMLSPKNMPLSENILCRKCGLPVFASAENKYQFECLAHGELDYEWTKRVDPVEYKRVLEYTFETLETLIQKSCPQDSNL